MTKKWLDLFLVQSSIPLSQGWLDLRSVKSPADRRTKAARRNASAISSAVISSLANGAASERPSELRHRQKQQCRRRKRMALSARDFGFRGRSDWPMSFGSDGEAVLGLGLPVAAEPKTALRCSVF
jgi:hypothetical protein